MRIPFLTKRLSIESELGKIKGIKRRSLAQMTAEARYELNPDKLQSHEERVKDAVAFAVAKDEGSAPELLSVSDEELMAMIRKNLESMCHMGPGIFGGLGPCLESMALSREAKRRGFNVYQQMGMSG